jgi:prepilin-type N-terminal cleavage/methylation domain-containing protein
MKQLYTNRGFSLIEVLIAIFILGMMLVFYQSTFSTIRLSRIAQQQDIALRIIQTKLEDLRAATYSGLPASGTFSDPLLSSLPLGAASTSITDYSATLKQVRVSVSWSESTSTLRYLEATTLIGSVGGL